MPWLQDSDVIWKLATFDLLSELMVALGADKSDFFVLPELRSQLRSNKFLEKQTRDAVQRVIEFVKGTKSIEKVDRNEQVILQAAQATYLNRIERIDGGEQLLFMATKTLKAGIISTHDKKALRTLAKDPSCAAIYERNKGRVLCLEQIVIRMINKYGYERIHKKIAPNCSIDAVMRESFANGKSITDHPEAECRKWLLDHIERLNSMTAKILAET
jgi:hypothetical protein